MSRGYHENSMPTKKCSRFRETADERARQTQLGYGLPAPAFVARFAIFPGGMLIVMQHTGIPKHLFMEVRPPAVDAGHDEAARHRPLPAWRLDPDLTTGSSPD
jgi:hypothetical protein